MTGLRATERPPLWLLALVGGGILSIWMLRQALTPFFVALVLAYLLAPGVERLATRMRRPWAVLLVVLIFSAGTVLLLRLVFPWLFDQAGRMVESFPALRAAAFRRREPWLHQHPWVMEKAQQAMGSFDPMILVRGVGMAGLGILGWFLHAMTLVLVPVILYYLLLDAPLLLEGLDSFVPLRHRDRVQRMLLDVHRRLGGYIRGQMAVAAAMSLLHGIAFTLLGVPYGWFLGLVAGISNFIPYSPYLTALPPALILVALGGEGWPRLIAVAVVFAGVQKIEALYFTPVWVGKASRLHPLEVLLAVLAFGFVFGVLGLIFAVPLMIVFKVAFDEFRKDYQQLPWFKNVEGSKDS